MIFYNHEAKIFLQKVYFFNETHISLNENVFSLNKRVKNVSEFSDFLLPEGLVTYLS